MHDIGGWYVETFGRDERGRTVLSPRHWDSFADISEMYILSHYFVSTYSSVIVLLVGFSVLLVYTFSLTIFSL
jgi:hypothetical protein